MTREDRPCGDKEIPLFLLLRHAIPVFSNLACLAGLGLV